MQTVQPERRLFPLFDPLCSGRVFSKGAVGQNSVEIVLEDQLLDRLIKKVSHEKRREVGGVFVGGYYTYNSIEFVTIDDFIEGQYTQSRALAVKFTHETWAAIQRDKEYLYPDKQIVGWYHTHPRSGVYFSQRDVFVHKNFFSLPWQVALVIDPNNGEYKFFQWDSDEEDVVECGHYFLTNQVVIS